jgi:type IV pilus assembly protein PilC
MLFHTLILRIPVVKDVVTKTAVARFARTFSALLGAGVSIVEALDVTGKAIGNAVYEKAFTEAIEDVKVGKPLSTVLARYAIFPPIVPQMLSVGEETGKIDTVLVKVADFYEEEVDVVINSMSAIIEPVMIVFMGAMVGLIVASVMGPITSLASQIH